jgi:hypothetical protein
MNREEINYNSIIPKPNFTAIFSLIIIIALGIISCKNSELQKPKYSFFVAGHTYGNPIKYQYGLYPPFVNSIDYINSYQKMSLGVFLGDVVPKPTETYWDSALSDISRFSIPIHIAAGNHDKGFEFEKKFNDYYYHFLYENDQFIILSPTNWNVDGVNKTLL